MNLPNYSIFKITNPNHTMDKLYEYLKFKNRKKLSDYLHHAKEYLPNPHEYQGVNLLVKTFGERASLPSVVSGASLDSDVENQLRKEFL